MSQSDYKWGMFYYKPDDPRFIVPKRNPWMGWTLNFANPYSYIFLSVAVLLAFLAEKFL